MQTLIEKLTAFKEANKAELIEADVLGYIEDAISEAQWEADKAQEEALEEKAHRMSDVEFDYKSSVGAI